MARKSIKGYAEKNYYDNTRFSGITAVGDELNEGNFKHLVNFDIADTGRSLTPRKGFLTTALKNVTLSDTTIYFQDAGTGKYIFIDFANTKYTYEDDNNTTVNGIDTIPAYAADMSLDNEYINVTPITTFDYADLISYVGVDNTSKIIPVSTLRAEPIYDEYQIRRNIIKVKIDDNFWIEIVYNPVDNSLLFTLPNFDDTVSINSADRNIASSQSIIPNPLQYVYESEDTNKPAGFFNQFPLIYVKDDNGFLLETANSLASTYFIPHYLLEAPSENFEWAYTYDITSTSMFHDSIKHEGSIFRLSDNTRISLHINLFKTAIEDTINNPISKYEWDINYKRLHEVSEPTYREFLTEVSWDSKSYFKSSLAANTLVLYIVPKDTVNMTNILRESLPDDYTIFLKDLVCNLFSNSQVSPSISRFEHIFTNNFYKTYTDNFSLNFSEESTLDGILGKLKTYQEHLGFYVKPLSDINDEYYNVKDFTNSKQFALYSKIIGFSSNPLTYNELVEYLNTRTFDQLYIRKFYTSTTIEITDIYKAELEHEDTTSNKLIRALFPYYNTTFFGGSTADVCSVYTCLKPGVHFNNSLVNIDANLYNTDTYCMLFKTIFNEENYEPSLYPNIYPKIVFNGTEYPLDNYIVHIIPNERYLQSQVSLFYRVNRPNSILHNYLVWNSFNSDETSNGLREEGFFEQGAILTFYLLKIPLLDNLSTTFNYNALDRTYLTASTSLKQTRQIILSNEEPSYILEFIEDEPKDIREFKNSLVFRDTLGDHLVVYGNNKVYISEANKYYYFKYTSVFEYPERIVKVIQYKDTLLVFTIQHLYSIFPFETTQTVQDGVDDEGNAKYVQTTYIVYNTLPVLYNLMIDEHYKDAIQVFNQMVLFYSADGQMFMIKPTATIDSNTRFSIQYFNKDANDILLNYDMYINERLKEYGLSEINKDDVQIKVLVSINYIKILYNVPDIITYILIYDVINNRYYTYDTTTFSDIKDVFFIQNNEMYISNKNNKTYFTIPYRTPNDIDVNVDKAVYFDFSREPIACEIDSGNINLNNHLKKRFRNLHTIYKNLDANELEFTSETFLDDVPIYTDMGTHLEIRDSSLGPAYTTVEHSNKVNLLKDNTVLFNFSDYSSNKIITHKSNIVSRGKVFRVRLRFKSKGRYKFQGFGIIYKEHSL